MSDNVEKIVQDAASNVACESKEEISKKTLEVIKNQLLGVSNHSDESFIYGLYKSAVDDKIENNEVKKYARKWI